jgi:hypothetical protein
MIFKRIIATNNHKIHNFGNNKTLTII